MNHPLDLRSLETPEDMAQAEDLQRAVWPGSETDIVPAHLMVTLAHNGGVLLGAFDGGHMVGYVMGFLGTDAATPDRVASARLKHCSHQMGVLPEYRDRGIGLQLKMAQRDVVMRQGVRLITWTYDPLLSRNAQLNIRRLGAVCRAYVRDAYGKMRDGLNAGIASDRFEVEWWITSRRVSARLQGERQELDLAHFLAAGAQELNPSGLDADGLASPTESPQEPRGNLALVEIPADFGEIRRRNAQLASAWRLHTREIFETAFRQGYIVTDFVSLRDGPYPRSYYLLSHGEGMLG
jgi:predicted GNAT superfamily acetyltransferase